jgi:hypothetical protein
MNVLGRISAVAGAAVLAATGLVAMTGSAALAAGAGPCYAVGGYSFKDQLTSGTLHEVHVFRGGSCSGGEIANGSATYGSNTDSVTLWAQDISCDGVGITVYSHGYSRSSTGCATNIGSTHPYTSYGNPKNFWVTVGGTTNSHALSLPRG